MGLLVFSEHIILSERFLQQLRLTECKYRQVELYRPRLHAFSFRHESYYSLLVPVMSVYVCVSSHQTSCSVIVMVLLVTCCYEKS